MNVICPYCNRIVFFNEVEWSEMDEENDDGCHGGYCPECGADCCFSCGSIYEPGDADRVITPPVEDPRFADYANLASSLGMRPSNIIADGPTIPEMGNSSRRRSVRTLRTSRSMSRQNPDYPF